jgi:hypothetical protein
VARELLSLQTVLELIQEDVADESKTFPTTLEQHVSGVVTNCNSVVVELQECITNMAAITDSNPRLVGPSMDKEMSQNCAQILRLIRQHWS